MCLFPLSFSVYQFLSCFLFVVDSYRYELFSLADRPIIGLPKYKLTVVNICEMHGTGRLEVLVS